jgi:glyoxylase-like metal-dependent hydrolase (beta-lactamase superfamily II)
VYGDRILDHLYRVAWWDMAGEGIVNADSYAIDCGETVILIDSGRSGSSYSILKENLIYWGLWDRISVCLLTHLHRDHAGGVSQLQSDGVKVWGGEGAVAYCQDERVHTFFNGNVPCMDRVLQDGETFSFGTLSFKVLATPGHTSTCVTYLVTIDSVLCAFTGDLVMPNGTIWHSGGFDFNSDQLLDSLSYLLEHEFDAVLTGHMLQSTQPEGFWLSDGKKHVLDTFHAGKNGKWVIQNK